MSSRKLRALIVSVAMTLAIPAPTREAPRRAVLNRVVAVVEDGCITSVELDRRWSPRRRAFDAWQNPDGRGREELRRKDQREELEAMIDARLVAKTAADRGIVASPADVDVALASLARDRSLSLPALLAEAKRQGVDEPLYRTLIAEQILEARLVRMSMADRGVELGGLPAEERDARFSALARELRAELRRDAYVYSNLAELERP